MTCDIRTQVENVAAMIDEMVHLTVESDSELNGRIIRCSNNDGMYIIGCQMPEDDYQIQKYVESCLKKGELSFS